MRLLKWRQLNYDAFGDFLVLPFVDETEDRGQETEKRKPGYFEVDKSRGKMG